MPSAFVPSIVTIQLTVMHITTLIVNVFKIFNIAIILLNMTHAWVF